MKEELPGVRSAYPYFNKHPEIYEKSQFLTKYPGTARVFTIS
jgi:hypothetical protein